MESERRKKVDGLAAPLAVFSLHGSLSDNFDILAQRHQRPPSGRTPSLRPGRLHNMDNSNGQSGTGVLILGLENIS
jgi:hypothetical protein